MNEEANYDERFWDVLATDQQADRGASLPRPRLIIWDTRFTSGMEMRLVTDLKNVAITQQMKKKLRRRIPVAGPTGKRWIRKARDCGNVTGLRHTRKLNGSHASVERQSGQSSYEDLLNAHTSSGSNGGKNLTLWSRWRWVTTRIRFNLFQLFSTYYGDDARLNIGPKGFRARSMVVQHWDTEAFAFPVYLGITDPKVTRNLLMYRYKQLDGAY